MTFASRWLMLLTSATLFGAGVGSGTGQAHAQAEPAGPGRTPLPRGDGAATVSRAEIERLMTDLSNWSRWGEDDELGTINLITPAVRREAAELVVEGVSVSMSVNPSTTRAVDNPTPIELTVTSVANGAVILDTWRISHHGYSFTHLDALCHWLFEGKMYNGFEASDVTSEGCQKVDIEVLKNGIVSRGVIVDIPRMKNLPYLEAGTPITRADVESWEEHANVRIRPGDVVLFRTGRWKQRAEEGPFSIQGRSAGVHISVVPLLKERDVALVGSDVGFDVVPTGVEGVTNPVHTVLLVALGMPIIDNADLEAVAATAAELGRPVFMFAAAPIPVPGASGSLLNAIATF